MNMRIVAVVLVAALVVPVLAQAQPARWVGVAVAAAGAAMMTIDPTQPRQPTQPGIVPMSTLTQEVSDYLESNMFAADAAEAALDLFDPRLLGACLRFDACLAGYGVGAISGGFAAAAGALTVVDSGTRTVYEDQFKPFIPFKERSAGLKYGGAALVIGGAALAALWPSQPALENVSVAPLRGGGVRAAKTFGF